VRVAVVGVHRDARDLARREDRLEVFGAVVEVLRELVLARDTEVEQCSCYTVRATVELAPGYLAVALDLRRSIGKRVRYLFPDVGEIEVAHGPPREVARLYATDIVSDQRGNG